jgi:hypothetical protein
VGIATNPGPSRVSTKDRWRVVILKERGLKPAGIARAAHTSRQNVYNILSREEETGDVAERSGRGRKKIYSEADIKKIVKKAEKKKKAPQIALELGGRSTDRTIQRRLKEKGFVYAKVQKVEKLTKVHKKKRVVYAQENKEQDWRRVFFSDEKTFQLGAGNEYAWQLPEERIVLEFVKHAPKLHVWGAIGAYIKTPLYFFEENMDSKLYQKVLKQRIKEEHLIYAPDAPKKLKKKWEFLQDGARSHTAKKSMEVIRELVGDRLHNHPAKSPDLNPIEDMWSYLDRKVKEARITTIRTLKQKLKKEWAALSWDYVRKSVDSMPRRLQSIKKSKGNRVNY